MEKIWVVDDDTSILNSLDSILTRQAYKVCTYNKPELFLEQIKVETPAVVILDIFFDNSKLTGEDIVKILSEEKPLTQVLVMSGETDVQKTLNCLKFGALDFLEKPVSLPRLLTSVKNALSIYNSRSSSTSRCNILGQSDQIKKLRQRIKKIAALKESVLITGESGTGKELVAENLHIFSPRYARNMFKINCTSLNPNLIESELFGHKKGSFTGAVADKKGVFELSHQSSLFIDEIGDFEVSLQSKILRVLQENNISPVGSSQVINIDSRLIFATHQDLDKMIHNNLFREDLYFRISTFTIELPPLREHLEDVDELAQFFLNEFVAENNLNYKMLSSSSLSKLKEYDYPGNIRELAKVVKNAAFFCDSEIIQADDIEFRAQKKIDNIWQRVEKMDLNRAKASLEKEMIVRRLKKYKQELNDTAESLGILKNNLYRKLKEHGIVLSEI